MKHNITAIEQNATREAATPCRADVAEAANGEALVILVGDETFPVIAHADGVPPLHVGDRVVFLATNEGAVVTHRLRAPGERPTQGFTVNPDGSLSIDSRDGITLATDHATLELRADGRILIEGEELYSLAVGVNCLRGSCVKVN